MHTKYCLATCLCLLSSLLIHAQLRVGVIGGLNLNQAVGGNKNNTNPHFEIDRYDLHTDYHIGLTADIPITKRFHIRPDLLFSKRFADFDHRDNAEGVYYSQSFKVNYIELPVHFVYYRQLRHLALYLGGGPYVGFALSGGEAKNSGGAWDVDGWGDPIYFFSSREEDWYRKTSFGAVLAAGVDLPFGLTGELSVRRGFGNENISRLNDQNKLINFNYGISVGYLLGRKRT